MIYETTGDLLACSADVICHQTNFQGVMGSGVAWSIRNKLLSHPMYINYEQLCRLRGRNLLGTVQFLSAVTADGHKRIVCNCFSQDDRRLADGSLTRYDCMKACFIQVEAYARQRGYSVALPGYMGCGVAGGDWKKVYTIIQEIFGASSVPLTIVHWVKHVQK